MERRQLKRQAKDQLFKSKSVYWIFVLQVVIVSAFVIIQNVGKIAFPMFAVPITLILCWGIIIPLELGLIYNSYKVSKGEGAFTNLFYRFTSLDKWYRTAAYYFIYGMTVLVGLVLFIVPGVIWLLMYSQTAFIMNEEDCNIFEAMSKSSKIMKGHKWELFVLQWSFILWYILSIVTVGIGFIFVAPYVVTTLANYYDYAKGDFNDKKDFNK